MTKRPSVLALATTFPREPGDGTPEFVLSLAQQLTSDFNVTVMVPRIPGARRIERWNGVEIVRFPYFFRRWEGVADGAILPNLRAQRWRLLEVPCLVLSMLWHVWWFCRRRRPGVVHAHWLLPAGLVATVVQRTLRIPFVVTVHGADVYGIGHRAYVRFREWIASQASAVLPVSRDLATRLESQKAIKTVVVPMGVDVDQIERATSGRSRITNRFMFVGRLADKKGVDVLLRALANVDSAELVVLGDGPERITLEALSRNLGLGRRAQFLGQQPRAQVLEYLATCGALVIPSRIAPSGDREGTPVVLGEGIAAGIPIIASRVGGLAERIEDGATGVLVDAESVDALATALEEAIDNPEGMAQLAKRAREELRGSALDVETTAKRYGDVLLRALRSGQGDQRGTISSR